MYLVEDKIRPQEDLGATQALAGESIPIGAPGGKWRTFPNSLILNHGAACCDLAHEWLIGFDFAQRNGGGILSGPRWISEHSAWGPTVWPIHWCEVVDAKKVDCGVHAALTHEIFMARGVTAFRAQFVQRYSADTAASWRNNWNAAEASDHWIDGDHIYHEGNAVLVADDALKLWDGSAGCWLNPRSAEGYGSLAAVRVETVDFNANTPRQFTWAGRRIPANQWVFC